MSLGKKERLASWRAISKAVSQGLIHSAGVSNYGIRHLEELQSEFKNDDTVKLKLPSINQIDLHPFMQRRETVEYCQTHKIVLEVRTGPTRVSHLCFTKV